jgi:hypothetical protein
MVSNIWPTRRKFAPYPIDITPAVIVIGAVAVMAALERVFVKYKFVPSVKSVVVADPLSTPPVAFNMPFRPVSVKPVNVGLLLVVISCMVSNIWPTRRKFAPYPIDMTPAVIAMGAAAVMAALERAFVKYKFVLPSVRSSVVAPHDIKPLVAFNIPFRPVIVRPVSVRPANIGLLVIAISCTVPIVITPDPDTVVWLATANMPYKPADNVVPSNVNPVPIITDVKFGSLYAINPADKP